PGRVQQGRGYWVGRGAVRRGAVRRGGRVAQVGIGRGARVVLDPVGAWAGGDAQGEDGGLVGDGRGRGEVDVRVQRRWVADRQQVAGREWRRAEAGERVVGTGAQHGGHQDTAADGDVGPQAGGRDPQGEGLPGV